MADDILLGHHSVLEALRSGRKVRRLLYSGDRKRASEALILADEQRVPVRVVSRQVLDGMGQHHQGIAAEIEPYPYLEVDELLGGELPLIIVLDSLKDPQNFGTLIRTGAAVGATGVVIPKHRTVSVTPAVERASAGTISKLKVARATNLARALDQMRAAGVWVVGIDARATDRYDNVKIDGPIAIVVGSESEGLGRLVKERCDLLVRVPMIGGVESMNAGVAGSIVLSEIFRQREKAGQIKEGALPPPRAANQERVATRIADDEDYDEEEGEDDFEEQDNVRSAEPAWTPPRNPRLADRDERGDSRPAAQGQPFRDQRGPDRDQRGPDRFRPDTRPDTRPPGWSDEFEERPRQFDDRPRQFDDRPRQFNDRPQQFNDRSRQDDRPAAGRGPTGPTGPSNRDDSRSFGRPSGPSRPSGGRPFAGKSSAPRSGGSAGRPSSGGYGRPSPSGFGRPSSGGSGRPSGGSFGRPSSGGPNRPSSGGFGRPAAGGSDRPSSGGSGRPASSGFGRPSSGGASRPGTGGTRSGSSGSSGSSPSNGRAKHGRPNKFKSASNKSKPRGKR